MIKIFLAEDELTVREDIKNNINWKAHGYEFCGEASDGELAFPMIQKLKPDIVLTDIGMPFMDGLVLSKLIKKEMPWMEIILLADQEELEYAKEDARPYATGYLLKPVDGEELLKKMDALTGEIEERHREHEARERYKKEREENLQNEKKILFEYLVTGEKSPAELFEMAQKMKIDLSAIWYNIVLVQVKSRYRAHDAFLNGVMEAGQKIKSYAAQREPHLLFFDRHLEGNVFLFKADSKEELERKQKEYLDEIKEILSCYDHVRYFGGIGKPVNRLRELPVSFEEASRAFAHCYLAEGSLILSSEDSEGYIKKEDFDIENINPKQIDKAKIQEFLKTGDREQVISFVDEFFEDLGTDVLRSSILRQYIVLDAYFCVVEFLEGLQISKDEIETPEMSSGILQSPREVVLYIARIAEKALELRENVASNRYDDIIKQIMQYIENNYADEELSLNLLASHVNFSPNHLSMLFSQHTGQTLIKYITDFRMNKAKEMLRCTGKKSSVIGAEVGYKDPHYFSYLFKKTQGMTPTQYRNGEIQKT